MTTKIRHAPDSKGRRSHPEGNAGFVDTSLIYEELRSRFKRDSRPIDVDFRSLVGWVRLGDQYTHQLHPYPAKLLPHIANFFVNSRSVRGESGYILDPFCGSGTVALEASLAGINPLVIDANPFALLLTKVKTFPYDVDDLRGWLKSIVGKSKKYRVAPTIDVIHPNLWYKKEHLEKLNIIARAISEVDDIEVRDFFRVGLSLTARKVSFADPAVSVPVRLKVKPNLSSVVNERISQRLRWIDSLSVIDEFYKVCDQNIQRIAETNFFRPNRVSAIQVGVDARQIGDLSARGIQPSLVLTSPPYGSAQKYIRASSLSLNWLELASPDGLSALEGVSIGREHLPRWQNVSSSELEGLPDQYERLLAKIASVNQTRSDITRQYLIDMRCAAREIAKVLPREGHAVFVVGNNTVTGELLSNDDFLIRVCAELGLALELELIDHIKSRGLMTKRNQTASVIARESVLVFKKVG